MQLSPSEMQLEAHYEFMMYHNLLTMSCWTNEQSNYLCNLVRKNLVNYTYLEPNYLFEVTQEHFPDFIEQGPSARNSAIQCLCKSFGY